MKNDTKKTLVAVSIMMGTVIGAGILGVPYVIMKSGFGFGMLNMVIIGIALTITLLYLGEIALRTKKMHQLTGYAQKYLGNKSKKVMFFAFAFGIYAALLAYLIGEGNSLSQLFYNNTQHSLWFGIGFWLVLSAMTYHGIKALEEGEKWGVSIIAILIILILVYFWNDIEVANLTYNNIENIITPFGVILFAFLGFSTIPEVGKYLSKDKKLMKRSIIISKVAVFIIYALFALVILGSQGLNTPEIATLQLGKIFVVLGMLTMFTSYLALSIALIDSLRYDYYLTRTKAWLATIIIPLIVFILLEFFNWASFTKVIGIGGVITGGLKAILILMMVKQAKKKSEVKPAYSIPYSPILTFILCAIFIIGAVMEIVNVF